MCTKITKLLVFVAGDESGGGGGGGAGIAAGSDVAAFYRTKA